MSKTEEQYGEPVTIDEMVGHYKTRFLRPDQFRELLVALQEKTFYPEVKVERYKFMGTMENVGGLPHPPKACFKTEKTGEWVKYEDIKHLLK